MQLSLHIDDEVYQKLESRGIDMQLKIDEYLLSLADNTEKNLASKEFEEDKRYFHNRLRDIENEKVKPLPHQEIWNKIDNHTK